MFGVLADKRWPEMVERLGREIADATVVPVRERRSEDPARVAELFRRFVPTRVESDAAAAVARWLDDPACGDDVVLVVGSLFLVGEVGTLLR